MSLENSISSDSTKENLEVDTSVADVGENTVATPTSSSGASNDIELITAISKQKGDQADWPLDKIKEPHKNDVLYGRGGGTNHHPGNKRYRLMVERRKADYVNSKRLDKPLVALEIIKVWREQEPPGRFLKMDDNTGLWSDVGDKKAREKTSQALREKAPLLKKPNDDIDYGPVEGASTKYTRFDDPPRKKIDHPLTLQRDHSLGRDILETTEKVAVDNFSWDSGLVSVPEGNNVYAVESSWIRRPPEVGPEHTPIDPYNQMTSPHRNPQNSHIHGVNPPFTASIPHTVSDGWSVSGSTPVTPVRSAHLGGGYEWPPQPVEQVPLGVDGSPARWTSGGEYNNGMVQIPRDHEHSPQPVEQVTRGVDGSPARWTSGREYNKEMIQNLRDHETSLKSKSDRQHPVQHREEGCATDVGSHHFAQVADILHERDWREHDNNYGSRYHSGDDIPVEYDQWASPLTPRQSNKFGSRDMHTMDSTTVPNDDPFEPHVISGAQVQVEENFGREFRPRNYSGPGISVSAPMVSPASEASIPATTPLPINCHSDTSPRRKRDSNVRTRGRNTPVRQGNSNLRKPSSLRIDSPPNLMGKLSIAKPPPVKRDTSNQNENSETKRCVKKMNRQRSIGNRPDYLHKVSEKEVVSLGNSLEQSSLENLRTSDQSSGQANSPKVERPDNINSADRNRTIDSFDIAIESRIIKTDLQEHSGVVAADCGPWSASFKPNSFPFPEHESPENKSQSSMNLSVPPLFLTNDDRLSSLGSVEVTDIEDFTNTESA